MSAGPALYSLRGARAFQEVMRTGVCVHAGPIRVHARAARADPDIRVGFAIARRQIPRAVDRNRIKRLVRESVRAADGLLAGIDLVVLARRDAVQLGNDALRARLAEAWPRVASRSRARQTPAGSP